MFSYCKSKVIFCFSLLSLFALTATAASDTLYFVGNIKINKSVSYKYNLRFAINADNQVTGYSLTDPGGPNETKTKITGSFDSSSKTLTYEEKNVLRSRVNLQKNDLCFVKATLKLKKNKLLETLSGKFTGTEPGKTEPCASGEVKLINSDRYKVIMRQIGEQDIPTDSAYHAMKKDKTIKISSEKGKELLITGSIVKLTIWDNGQVDGDRISITLNDKYVLENYTITSATKVIEIPLSSNAVDTLKVIALNEGTLPPNTAAIQIETQFERYPILTMAREKEIRTMYLKKKAQ